MRKVNSYEKNKNSKNKTFKKLLKKSGAILLIATMVTAALSGCGNSTSSSDSGSSSNSNSNSNSGSSDDKKSSDNYTTVKILLAKESLCLGVVHFAIENGYFDEEFENIGQKYEIVEGEVSQTADLVATGQVNAAYGLTASYMEPISNGLNIVFTTGLHRGCTKFYTKPDSGIDSVADLKGKTVGVPSLSDSSTLNIKRKIADAGLDVVSAKPDVEFVAYAMTDLPAALENGAIDAIGLHDPVATTAEEEFGFKKFLDTGEDEKFAHEYCCQAFVSADLIEKNPEGAAAYTRAMQKAAAYIQALPYEAAQTQVDKKYITGDPEHNGLVLDSLNFTPSVSLGQQTFKDAFADLQEIGILSDSLDADEFFHKATANLDGVPDGYVYDADTKTFTETTAEEAKAD